MKCEHCDTRIGEGESFRFHGFDFCCNCMSMLCSWFLDGGTEEAPDAFAYILGVEDTTEDGT